MMNSKPASSHLDEDDQTDGYDSSSYKGGASGGRVRVKAEQRGSSNPSHRSKHSETEQRRRSKINERFQILRDLIPQNDQKRDKASFLLEVIEYIQFLHEKLQIYEGSYRGWSQEQDQSVQWKSDDGSAELDNPQVAWNGSARENSVILEPAQSLMEQKRVAPLMYKSLDPPPGSSSSTIPFDLQMQLNTLSAVGQNDVATEFLQESLSDADDMAHQFQSRHLWQGQPCASNYVAPIPNGQEELRSQGGTASISSAYSREILSSLTNALHSSGVDLSQTSVSVHIDVSKIADIGANSLGSGSKDEQNHCLDNQEVENSEWTKANYYPFCFFT